MADRKEIKDEELNDVAGGRNLILDAVGSEVKQYANKLLRDLFKRFFSKDGKDKK